MRTGHKNIKGNEIGDKQPKEGDNEVMGADIKYIYYQITLNKEEAVQELKKNLKIKWQRKYGLFEKVEQVQEVFKHVKCRRYDKERTDEYKNLSSV